MGFIAIVGSGPLGGTLAHKLAGRDRISEVRLIDTEGRIARGKALDIQQSAPVERFSTRLSAADSIAAASGADVIVVADDGTSGNEHAGEAGLALVREISRIDGRAPILFAGAQQRQLMTLAVRELHIDRARLVGSAPYALESAVRALAGVLLDATGVDISLRVVGVPPRSSVVVWESAAVAGFPLASRLPPHEMAAITARLPSLWPPGPYALASAAARVAEAMVLGARREFSCFVSMETGSFRDAVAAMPVELGRQGIKKVAAPALTRQEQTLLENAIEK